MDKVVIRHFQEEPCTLYDNNDNKIGVIDNYLTFLDVKAQLLEKKLNGYYITFKGQRINLNEGTCEPYVKDLFPLIKEKLIQVLALRRDS